MAISLTGLDMSWLKNPANRLPDDMKVKPRVAEKKAKAFGFMPDIDVIYNGGFESPIDGSHISSRSHLREHNIRHDVVQAGDIRGERLKAEMRKHMKYDPAKRTENGFSWAEPTHPRRSRSGNLTEI